MGRDGGVFAFGDAPYAGSTGALRLNQPIVAITPPAFRPGESIAPGLYREQSDNHPSFTIQGGRVVSATSSMVISGSERLDFTVGWPTGFDGSGGVVSASMTNTSGVPIRFPDGVRVDIRIFKDRQLWREITVVDLAVRHLDPGGHLSLTSSTTVVAEGDGQYGFGGETTIVLP